MDDEDREIDEGEVPMVGSGNSGCEPYSADACKAAASKAGLKIGTTSAPFEFGYMNYCGCFAYRSGVRAGHAFYGNRGSCTEQQKQGPLPKKWDGTSPAYRPLGYDCADGGEVDDSVTAFHRRRNAGGGAGAGGQSVESMSGRFGESNR